MKAQVVPLPEIYFLGADDEDIESVGECTPILPTEIVGPNDDENTGYPEGQVFLKYVYAGKAVLKKSIVDMKTSSKKDK